FPLINTLGAGSSADRIGSFQHPQRFGAGDQVGRCQTSRSQLGDQQLGLELHAQRGGPGVGSVPSSSRIGGGGGGMASAASIAALAASVVRWKIFDESPDTSSTPLAASMRRRIAAAISRCSSRTRISRSPSVPIELFGTEM